MVVSPRDLKSNIKFSPDFFGKNKVSLRGNIKGFKST